MQLHIFTTGGTIDKVYFDANSEFAVGDSLIPELLQEANVNTPYLIDSLLRKDSLEITDTDRQMIVARVAASTATQILITHGTDTMPETARALQALTDKTIVLTGAMQPARMRRTDAIFNLGFALAALQTLPPGVFICMNGQIFTADNVRKNRAQMRFEAQQ